MDKRIHFNKDRMPEVYGWEIPGSSYQGKMQFATVEDAERYLGSYSENDRECARTFFANLEGEC